VKTNEIHRPIRQGNVTQYICYANNTFGGDFLAAACWIKYREYDAVQRDSGDWYIMLAKDATSSVCDPIEKAGE